MCGKTQNQPDATKQGDMQDGMLAHYLEQAAHADSNIERRIGEEPFDFRDRRAARRNTKITNELRGLPAPRDRP
jgi:hypothetical protein